MLRGAKRADPNQPVLIPGDPEMATRAERLAQGVPVPDDLMTQLRAVAKSAGVPFALAPPRPRTSSRRLIQRRSKATARRLPTEATMAGVRLIRSDEDRAA